MYINYEETRNENECFLCKWFRECFGSTWVRDVFPFLFTSNDTVQRLRELIDNYVLPSEDVPPRPITNKLPPRISVEEKPFLPTPIIVQHPPGEPELITDLNDDVRYEILSHLPVADLKNVALLCNHAVPFADRALINKAKSFGYTGAYDPLQAKSYLNRLLSCVKNYQGALPNQLLVYTTLALDEEATLENLRSCTSNDIIQIMASESLTSGYDPLFIEFLLHFTQKKSVRVQPTDQNLVQQRDEQLFQAAAKGDTKRALLMILHGAAVEAQSNSPTGPNGFVGATPLVAAAIGGHKALAELLLQHGASVTTPAANNSLPVHFAAQKGHLELVNLFLDKGSPIDAPGFDNKTALCWAAEEGTADVVDALLARGANADLADLHGSCPIHWAAQKGHYTVVESLLGAIANINLQGADAKTAMHFAAEGAKAPVVQLLLANGADPNILDNRGKTVLHAAVIAGNFEMVRDVRPRIQNINLQDGANWTALQYARRNNYYEIANLLQQHGAI